MPRSIRVSCPKLGTSAQWKVRGIEINPVPPQRFHGGRLSCRWASAGRKIGIPSPVYTGPWSFGRQGCPADIAPASEIRPATAAKQTSSRITLRPAAKSTAGAALMVLTGIPVSASRRQRFAKLGKRGEARTTVHSTGDRFRNGMEACKAVISFRTGFVPCLFRENGRCARHMSEPTARWQIHDSDIALHRHSLEAIAATLACELRNRSFSRKSLVVRQRASLRLDPACRDQAWTRPA